MLAIVPTIATSKADLVPIVVDGFIVWLGKDFKQVNK